MGERLSFDEVNSTAGWGHRARYHMAAGFVRAGHDVVFDAACGIGYGSWLFPLNVYCGIDLLPQQSRVTLQSSNHHFLEANLETLDFDDVGAFDVGISFETIEHLDDYSNLIQQLKKARKWVICSVPVIPTVHMNEWHKHDFQPLEFPGYFEDDNWHLYNYFDQPTEFSQIYIFKKGV